MRTQTILIVAVALFSGSLLLNISLHLQKTREVKVSQERALWVVSQLEVEYLNFVNLLQRYSSGETAPELAHKIQNRFDILWSRLDLLFQGDLANRVKQSQKLSRISNEMRELLNMSEQAIFGLQGQSPGQNRQLLRSFERLLKPLHSGIVDLIPIENAHEAKQRDNFNSLLQLSLVLFIGVLVSGGVLVYVVFVETRKNQKLLASQKELSGQLLRQKDELAQTVEERTKDLRKAKEAAEQASEAKSKFLAAASHDLRQPLQAVGLFIAALKMALGNKKEDKREHGLSILNNIEQTIGSLGDLLSSLLDISKLEAGVVQLNKSVFPIADLLDRVGKTFAPLAEQKGLELRIVPCRQTVESDPVLLGQVIDNFVSNAIRYTEEGYVLIGCRRSGETLVVQIWDTGIGIGAEEQEAIFDEFHQLHNPARQSKMGLGLGLSIVKKAADLLGHPIGLRSKEGWGSVFSVSVPFAEGLIEVVATTEPSFEAPQENKNRILVVEDDPAVLTATVALLDNWGYQVSGAASPEEALGQIDKSRILPDLMVIDFRLPGAMNGLEIHQAVTQRGQRVIPGIIISGDTTPDHLEKFTRSSLTHLTKPVDPEELRRHVQTLLK